MTAPNTANMSDTTKEKAYNVSAKTLITIPSPYIFDKFSCVICQEEAELECPQCKKYFCHFCAVTKQGKPYHYCPRCGYRLHAISGRFIGSRKARKQMRHVHGKQVVVKSQKPLIIDKGKKLQ